MNNIKYQDLVRELDARALMSLMADRLLEYRAKVLGTKIRGQTIEHVELTVDTLGHDGYGRYIITLCFRENAVSNESQENNLLEIILNEIPKSCSICTNDPQEAARILTTMPSDLGDAWILDDEWDLR